MFSSSSKKSKEENEDPLAHCPISSMIERRCQTVPGEKGEQARMVCETLKRVFRNCPGKPPIEVESIRTSGEEASSEVDERENPINSFMRDPFFRDPFGSILEGFMDGLSRDNRMQGSGGRSEPPMHFDAPPAPHAFHGYGMTPVRPSTRDQEEIDEMQRAARNPDSDLV